MQCVCVCTDGFPFVARLWIYGLGDQAPSGQGIFPYCGAALAASSIEVGRQGPDGNPVQAADSGLRRAADRRCQHDIVPGFALRRVGLCLTFDSATLPLSRKRVRDELPDSAAALAARRVARRTAAVRLHDHAVDNFGVLSLPELESLLHQVRRLAALCNSDALLP